MKLRPAVAGAIALLVTAVCLAAGFWQLRRLGEKRALNAALDAALAAPAESLGTPLADLARQVGRKVAAVGTYDESRHILLSARFHDDDLGVEVLTPLFTRGSGVLLVDRGWLRAEDGQTAWPESLPEPGVRAVSGLLERLPQREGMPPWRKLPGPGAERWSTHELDSASVARYLMYPVLPFVLVALPGPDAPAEPVRVGPPRHEVQLHVSYAIQWFAFALVTVVGSIALALRGRARAARGP